MVNIPLHDLTHRIQQQEAALEKLRQELAARQSKLRALAQRKEDLLEAIQKLDAEIHAVNHVSLLEAAPSVSVKPAKPAAPHGPAKAGKPGEKTSFPEFLVGLVQQAAGPITAKELAEAVVRQQYPTASKNIRGMVEARIYDLVRKGKLQRADNQPGFVVAEAPAATASKHAKKPATQRRASPAKAALDKPANSAKPRSAQQKETLQEAITRVLAKSSQPLSAKELSTRLLADGYETKSKDLTNVIWVCIGKMKNIERVPGIGYRLKKARAASK